MKPLLAVYLIVLSVTIVKAQDFSLYEQRVFTHSNGVTLPYRILYPENYYQSKTYPLILFLHGAGERGADNETQLKHGGNLFTKTENRKNYPAIVLFPQCPKQGYWASAKVDRSKHPLSLNFDYTKQTTPALAAVLALLKQVKQQERVDTTRIYIIGLSMGGMGTFEAVYRNPQLFAAAIPICGGGDANRYDERVKPTSFWLFHGQADNVVNVEHSRVMAQKLKNLEVKISYTEYPGIKHNSWDNAFAEPNLLPWLFSQSINRDKESTPSNHY